MLHPRSRYFRPFVTKFALRDRGNEIPFRGLFFVAISFSVLGQVAADHYEALKHALGLSHSQVWQLQQRHRPALAIHHTAPTAAQRAVNGDLPAARQPRTPTTTQTGDSLRDRILDDSQQAKLALIEKVLHSERAGSAAIVLGLISPQQWPGGTLCYYPIPTYASELGLSDPQVWQFMQLQQAAREPHYVQIKEKENNRLQLLSSGVSADSPTVVQLVSDTAKLWRQVAEARPRRDLALAVLDDAQKAKLVAFETALQLASEAIELGLIPDPPKGEALCH